MAVGLKRAHAECVGQGEGLLVGGFGLFDLQSVAPRRDVAEEAQRIRLMAPFLVLTGMHERLLGEGEGVVQAIGQQMGLPQRESTQCLKDDRMHCRRLLHRLREQGYGVNDAPGQRVRLS